MLSGILKDYPALRKGLYAAYAVIGLVLTAIAAADGTLPWLVPAFAVYGVLGTGFGFVAQSNTAAGGVTDLTGTGGPVPEPSED